MFTISDSFVMWMPLIDGKIDDLIDENIDVLIDAALSIAKHRSE